MAVYRVVALLTDPNTLPCINTQGYQTSDAFATEVANHFSPFLALATHKKGVFHATQGRNTPYKKSTKRRLPPPLCAWLFLCSNVQFAMAVPLMRLLLSHAFACASASVRLPLAQLLLRLLVHPLLRLLAQLWLWLWLACPSPVAPSPCHSPSA